MCILISSHFVSARRILQTAFKGFAETASRNFEDCHCDRETMQNQYLSRKRDLRCGCRSLLAASTARTARHFVRRYIDVRIVVKLIVGMYLHLLDLSRRILQPEDTVILERRRCHCSLQMVVWYRQEVSIGYVVGAWVRQESTKLQQKRQSIFLGATRY